MFAIVRSWNCELWFLGFGFWLLVFGWIDALVIQERKAEMAPERKYAYMSKQEMIEKIRKVAEELGRSPSQADMNRAGVPWHRIYNLFGGMRPAVRAAGLEPGPRGEALNEGAMILDWAGVVRKLRRLPSRAEYDRMGKHHSGTLHARLDWSQMSHRFVLLAREFHVEEEWADVMAIVVKRYPLLGKTNPEPLKHRGTEEAEEGLESGDRVIGRSGDRNETQHLFTANDAKDASGDDGTPAWIRGMGLRRIASGALAVQMLIAMANGSTLPSAQRSTQPSAPTARRGSPSIQPLNSVDAFGALTHHGGTETRRTAKDTECFSAGDGDAEWAALPKDPTRNVPDPQPRAAVPHEFSPAVGHSSVKEPVVYGAPLGLAAMAHAPTNEGGVMFLFGVLAERLRFRIERIQTAYPDCEAKREVRPGVWERVRVELEYESRNFKEHRHDLRGCEVIVCWRHNWPECPRGIEVIELSRHI